MVRYNKPGWIYFLPWPPMREDGMVGGYTMELQLVSIIFDRVFIFFIRPGLYFPPYYIITRCHGWVPCLRMIDSGAMLYLTLDWRCPAPIIFFAAKCKFALASCTFPNKYIQNKILIRSTQILSIYNHIKNSNANLFIKLWIIKYYHTIK